MNVLPASVGSDATSPPWPEDTAAPSQDRRRCRSLVAAAEAAPHELLEDAPLSSGEIPGPASRTLNAMRSPSAPSQSHRPAAGILHGVIEQVVQHERHRVAIGQHAFGRRRSPRSGSPARPAAIETPPPPTPSVARIDRLEFVRARAGLEPSEFEQVLDQSLQARLSPASDRSSAAASLRAERGRPPAVPRAVASTPAASETRARPPTRNPPADGPTPPRALPRGQ